MGDWVFGIIGLIIGGAAGAAGVAMLLLRKHAAARTRAELLEAQGSERQLEIERGRERLAEVDQRRERAERELATLTEQLRAREQQFAEQQRLLKEAETHLSDAFTALGAKALQANNEQFLNLAKKAFETLMAEAKGDVEKRRQAIDTLVKPIHELLEKHNKAVGDIEKKREVAYRGLEEQIKQIAASHEKLNKETGRLVTALRRPEQRGRWGELQLRNVVELAGMTEHCDFEEQPQTDDPATRDRPDMTVNMPGGGVIVVDSKVALDAYLDALESEGDRAALLRRHAEQVEKHYRGLAAKKYWEQFDLTPRLVVMFMPLESALVAALEHKPDLHAAAMQNGVLLATPTLLVALLRAVAYGWQQEAIARNAGEIAAVGSELYDRIGIFVKHFGEVGQRLNKAAEAYNQSVGSLEHRVLPGTRKLRELHATAKEEIEAPPPIEIEAHPIRSIDPQGPGDGGRSLE